MCKARRVGRGKVWSRERLALPEVASFAMLVVGRLSMAHFSSEHNKQGFRICNERVQVAGCRPMDLVRKSAIGCCRQAEVSSWSEPWIKCCERKHVFEKSNATCTWTQRSDSRAMLKRLERLSLESAARYEQGAGSALDRIVLICQIKCTISSCSLVRCKPQNWHHVSKARCMRDRTDSQAVSGVGWASDKSVKSRRRNWTLLITP